MPPDSSTSVKLQTAPTQQYQTVTAYGDGFIEINAIRYESSVLVMPEKAVQSWPVGKFDELSAEHFEQLLAWEPEVIIFGTGQRQRFPRPEWLVPLMPKRIGVETMDIKAACRTYNILMSEGRRVLAALLIEKE